MNLTYLELVSPGERHKYIYMATPLSVFKKVKKLLMPTKKNNAVTYLKLWHETQLDSANNIGWVPSGHTSSSLCVRLIMSKMVHFDLITCSLLFEKSTTCLQSRHFYDYRPQKVGQKTTRRAGFSVVLNKMSTYM